MRRAYAENTSVPVEKTRAELDRMLGEAGATQRMFGVDEVAGVAFAGFSIASRQVRIRVPLPKMEAAEKELKQRVSKKVGGAHRFTDARRAEWVRDHYEQLCRSRWRALLLLVKAKLEAIAMGISTVEREFLADVSLPDGKSVYEYIADGIRASYIDGKMPPLLGSGS